MCICIPKSGVVDALVVCCCTRSIFLVFGVCVCILGDFFLVVIFSFSGLHFLGCFSPSSVILFGLDTGRVGGTSTGICLWPGTRTSTWAVSGVSVCLAVGMVICLGTSLATIFVVVGSGEDEADLDEAGGVGSVGELGETDERVFLGVGGDLCLLCLGDVGTGDGGGEVTGL
jgi:hypothetical protein